MHREIARIVRLGTAAAVLFVSSLASAQLAPTGGHYGGRPSDSGFEESVNSTGGYSTSVPLNFPPTRDGVGIPFSIVSGGRQVGAAGVGWDVPLSYVRVDSSVAKRKPADLADSFLQGRSHVTLSIAGSTIELVPHAGMWIGQTDAATYSATNEGSQWLVYDGHGHTYAFFDSEGVGISLLQNVSTSTGRVMDLGYSHQTVSMGGGATADAINLTSIAYNYHPNMGCDKDVISLAYDETNSFPISISALGQRLFTRTDVLSEVFVESRTSCTSATVLRKYSLKYAPDGDTRFPRLQSVSMTGRIGTAEETVSLPVATYSYYSATGGSGLYFHKTAHIDVPTDLASGAIGSSVSSSLPSPGPGPTYATFQNLLDFTGDGLPDLVYAKNGALVIARNVSGPGGAVTFAPSVTLGDGPQTIPDAIEKRSLSQNRYHGATNQENVWREALDVNGDGRLDIVDAGTNKDQWLVYLNTPSTGPSGVDWELRTIPVGAILKELRNDGHSIATDYLPLSRRSTGPASFDAAAGETGARAGDQYTYTEWDFRDINGDGFPDFVFDTAPVSTQTSDGNTQIFLSDKNDIYVFYDVAGTLLDVPSVSNPRETFSSSTRLVSSTTCGVGVWETPSASPYKGNVSYERCGFADVTGDGIPDRIDHATALIGVGTFYSGSIALPTDYMSSQYTGIDLCYTPGFTNFATRILSTIRDVTGDGIPDFLVLDGWSIAPANQIWVGTGAGFAAPVNVSADETGPAVSSNDETCDGTSSGTTSGLYDLDGDGYPELLDGLAYGIDVQSTVVGSTVGLGVGQISRIDNGYGATTEVFYGSAKRDALTAHDVPFPEVVVTSTDTRVAGDLNASFVTQYAYGGATMTYDPRANGFTFKGYSRTVSLQNSPGAGGGDAEGQATVTDKLPLASYVWGSNNVDRYARYANTGRTSSVTTLAGDLGMNAWALLGIDPLNDYRVIARTTYQYASKLFEESGLAGESIYDCLDFPLPYDYETSLALGAAGYDTCSAHGFTYASSTRTVRGSQLSAANVTTASEIDGIDDYARPTSVQYFNDVQRGDDDICVYTSFATPTNAGPVRLDAVSMQQITGCSKNNHTFALDKYEYDNATWGTVTAGLLTGKTSERHATDDGSLLTPVIRMFDVTYDIVGNPSTVTSVRDDGATRVATTTYDSWGLSPATSQIAASNAPVLTTSSVYDVASMQQLSSTDENGTVRSFTYDGFGRPLVSSIQMPDGTAGILDIKSYVGFQGGYPFDDRQVVTTTYDYPIDPGDLGDDSDPSHTSTTYLDALGRAVRTETNLGADYGNRTMVTGYRTFDSLGRVTFAADPYRSSDGPTGAYGTSFYYAVDGTPTCDVRATGPHAYTAVSDAANDVLVTCSYHGYANNLETWGTSAPDANTPGSSQAGVMRIETSTAIGRVLAVSTSQGGTLDYATYGYDVLGNRTSMTRYRSPSNAIQPVTTRWRYDSFGLIQSKQDPEGALQSTTYDSWNEPTLTEWTDTGTDHRIVNRYDALGRVIHREEQNGGIVDPDSVNDYVYDTPFVVGPEVSPTNVLGRLTQASSTTGAAYYSYDGYGRVNAETHVDDNDIRYVQRSVTTADGRLTGLDMFAPDDGYALEHVDYGYDSGGRARAASYAGPTGNMFLYSRTEADDFGDVLSAKYGGTTYQASYDPSGRRLLRETEVSSPSGVRDTKYASYDAVGRELERVEVGASGSVDTTSIYDQLGQLLASKSISGGATKASWLYNYDAIGNMTSAQDLVGTSSAQSTFRGIDEDELCMVGYPTLGGSGCNVVHDAAGNVTTLPTSISALSIRYYDSGLVKSIADKRKNAATFRYDANGELQEMTLKTAIGDSRDDKKLGGIFEVHDDRLTHLALSYVTRNIPGPGGLTASFRGAAAGWVFAFGDGRGMRVTTDLNGKFLQDVTYQPFGASTSTGVSTNTPQYSTEQWNGGDMLDTFGVVTVGARVYDPALGRFLGRDPLTIPRTAATTNPYAFAANDPVNRSDPSGKDWGCTGPEECGLVDWWPDWSGFPGFGSSSNAGSTTNGQGYNPPTHPPVNTAGPSSYPDGAGDGSYGDASREYGRLHQPAIRPLTLRGFGRGLVDFGFGALDDLDRLAQKVSPGYAFVVDHLFGGSGPGARLADIFRAPEDEQDDGYFFGKAVGFGVTLPVGGGELGAVTAADGALVAGGAGRVAVDANVLIHGVERLNPAVDVALAGRSPWVPPRAQAEFLVYGDPAALDGWLEARGGGILPQPDIRTEAYFLNNTRLSEKDAQVYAAAHEAGLRLLSSDVEMLTKGELPLWEFFRKNL